MRHSLPTRTRAAISAGKLTRTLLRAAGRTASAVPGHVALRMDPDLLTRVRDTWAFGCVFVLGSNGKTTTTKLLTGILREHGMRVFTNASGGNLPQGIASSMSANPVAADIGVIEVDEAFGERIAAALRPSMAVALNVQVDQIYRFGEPEQVAGMIDRILHTVTGPVILNSDDPQLNRIGTDSGLDAIWFGADGDYRLLGAPAWNTATTDHEVEVSVLGVDGGRATIGWSGERHKVALPAAGVHYAMDVAAAITAARRVLGARFTTSAALAALERSGPAFGRGEAIHTEAGPMQLLLQKNLASLQLNLDSLDEDPERVLIAMDSSSRDLSWLYSADLSRIKQVDVVSGPRAAFMALRLAYAGIPVAAVEPDLTRAVNRFLQGAPGPRTAILDYDQMMAVRRMFGRTNLEGGA